MFKANVGEALSAADLSNDTVRLAIEPKSGTIYLYDVRYLLQPDGNWWPHPSRINTIRFHHKVNMADSCPQRESRRTRRRQRYLNSIKMQSIREELEMPPAEPTHKVEIIEATPPKSQATLSEEKQTEIVTLSVVKAEVIASLEKTAEDIKELIVKQFASLENCFVQEMRTFEAKMENKWNILMFAASLNKNGKAKAAKPKK